MTIAKDVDNKSIIVVLIFSNYVILDFLIFITLGASSPSSNCIYTIT
jgi:hypothetical protein